MASEPSSKDAAVNALIQDPAHDAAHLDEVSSSPIHTHEEEVAHAWKHFRSDCFMFAIFFSVIILTVVTASINISPAWTSFFVFSTAALRSGLIAYYLLSLFKQFSLVKSTFIFSAIFLAGMILLSWWDSELRGIGNPIYNHKDPQLMKQ